MIWQVQAINEVSTLSPFPPQFGSINFTTSQSGTKSMYAETIHSSLFAQCIYVLLRLSPTITMSRHPPSLSFCFLSPRSALSLHNISSSAIWTQVALGHDRLSSHIMVKRARETERDEKWREDNQCGSPQKLWKQTVQFRCPSLAVSLFLFSIFSCNSSSDGFCRPVYDEFT